MTSLLSCPNVSAETGETGNPDPNATPTSADIISGNPDAAAVMIEGEPPPQVAPPPPPPQDRAKKNNAAMIAGIIGAAVAGASCAMLLAQAKQEQDPEKKKELMQKALQQCGQAAQSAASAAQNGDNKKQLTNYDQPKPEVAPMKFKTAKNTSKESSDKDLLKQFPQTEDQALPEVTEIDVGELPPVGETTGPIVADGGIVEDYSNFGISGEAEAGSLIGPPQNSNLQNVDSAKPVTQQGFTVMGSLGGAKSETTSKLSETIIAQSQERRARGVGGEAPEGGGSSGSSGGDSSSGGGDFGSILSQMLGLTGGEAGAAGSAVGVGTEFIALKPTKKGQPNIFEYASYRYKLLEKTARIESRGERKRRLIAKSRVLPKVTEVMAQVIQDKNAPLEDAESESHALRPESDSDSFANFEDSP